MKLDSMATDIVNSIAEHTIKLHNAINYEIRKSDRLYDLEYYLDKYSQHWRTAFIGTQSLKHTIINIRGNWKSYFSALKSMNPNTTNDQIKTKQPGFKHSKEQAELIFTKQTFTVQDNMLVISLPLNTARVHKTRKIVVDLIPEKKILRNYKTVQFIQVVFSNVKQIRIKWSDISNQWQIIILYAYSESIIPQNHKNVMSVDIGLNNLCAITFRYGLQSYLINGRPLKSTNRHYNYQISIEESKHMKNLGDSRKYKENKEIKKIRNKLENYVSNYMHQATAIVLSLAAYHQCKIIVIGNLHGIKQRNTNNRSFIQVPLLNMVNLIKYKARKVGIHVILINEAYTSSCSSVDMVEISSRNSDAKQRIYRGAYLTANGLMINSDINGSLNILRKFLNQVYSCNIIAKSIESGNVRRGSIPELILFTRAKGYMVGPVKLDCFTNRILK